MASNSSSTYMDRLFYINLGKNLNLVMCPILLGLGNIGNILSIIILFRKKDRNPTLIYLGVLAIFDLLVLNTGLLRNYLKELLKFDIRQYSSITCKVHIYLTYVFMQTSSYVLVAVALNRFTTVFNRTIYFKRRPPIVKNTKKMLKNEIRYIVYIIISIAAIIALMNIPFLLYYEYTFDEGKSLKLHRNVYDCTVNRHKYPGYYGFRIKYFGVVHLIVFIIVPCIILVILNIAIIRKITIAGRNISRGTCKNDKKDKKRATLSIMLVVVCLWFIVLKTPASTYITFPVEEEQKPYFPLIYHVFMLVNYTNHAVNFIIYTVTSSEFRREFKKLFYIFSCKRYQLAKDTDTLDTKSSSKTRTFRTFE